MTVGFIGSLLAMARFPDVVPIVVGANTTTYRFELPARIVSVREVADGGKVVGSVGVTKNGAPLEFMVKLSA
jgi:hypothetical protein